MIKHKVSSKVLLVIDRLVARASLECHLLSELAIRWAWLCQALLATPPVKVMQGMKGGGAG
ncbi:hypothetical protein Kisp02_02930 [Kineosporia sp. NBRC 101731]|nr:hypothetical protein Kisp02_02930 [Kineosporia sp. NBRC 101731]